MEVCKIIRKRREELGLTYEELGRMVGVGKSTVRKWELGLIENMRRDSIVALAKALNISPSTIMGWEEATEKAPIDEKEQLLINNYNRLNDLGKEKLLDYSNDLIENIRYIYTEPVTIAAHDDSLTNDEKNVALNKILEFEKNLKK